MRVTNKVVVGLKNEFGVMLIEPASEFPPLSIFAKISAEIRSNMADNSNRRK